MLLTASQLRKANSAKSPRHLRELARSEGINITEEESKTFFSILQKSKSLSEEEKAMVTGCGCVMGHSCHTSGEAPLYAEGDRMLCTLLSDDGPVFIDCLIVRPSKVRLGDLFPEYAYLVKYLESHMGCGAKEGELHWTWETHLKNK